MISRQELRVVQSIRGNPAVSLLVPTHRHGPGNQQDPIRVRNGLKRVQERLEAEASLSKREVRALLARFDALVEEIPWQHTLDGLALFVSEDHASAHLLPYPIEERVILGDTFATRDLVRALNRTQRYRVLVLSEKPTRLYDGHRDKVEEVRGHGFPLEHVGPGGAAPLGGGRGISASAQRDEAHRQFFREVDAQLLPLQREDRLPIVLTGVDRYLAFFEEVADHARDVVARLQGSYDHLSEPEVAKAVWPLVREWIDARKQVEVGRFEKAVSSGRYASGIVQCWRAAKEGRVGRLLVEESYAVPATVGADNPAEITLASDPTAPGVVDDIVDELIETVIGMGGEVLFVEDGALAEHQAVGAELRH